MSVFTRTFGASRRALFPALRAAGEVRIPSSASELRIPEDSELVWDDGRHRPEPALDDNAPTMSSAKSLGMLIGGFAVFAGVYSLARILHDERPVAKRDLSEAHE
ncbi:mitochondrial Complex I (CI) NADH:ubiquinone oxidoreductase subunit ASHI/NIAM/NDUFB8 [Andalucia godoyi]|uniref:Mitochondrial Complex I (CI) NADH:ubiquinone oxidoreductase subunit ASHI/NIAM/NDUFB8 n=1 Tax=Andalucia godoyi TaxID=505711 RepID=A0A8K0AHS0_ANDGO|nr:mitochondrial Complex I (CI) NADH:ubiquinone oxidoreductase subunit ASHI/NIAM/NDUFB8 [Andalucia godoyi]|eukprot:ANDGO_03237.mRNA.1 mitochondrial Complex I (CI) NADH:ubiquinone oxidoreductase subunit ASHI/NIAM/NDUFB8